MKIKYYITNTFIYAVTEEGKTFRKRLKRKRENQTNDFEEVEPQNSFYPNAFIYEVEKDEPISLEDIIKGCGKFRTSLKKEREEIKAENERRKKELQEEFLSIERKIKEGEVFESNLENIFKILRYLNSMNWGVWELPKMTIGYKANQYDDNGKNVTTITLDKPIRYHDEMTNKFKSGGSRHILPQYHVIRSY